MKKLFVTRLTAGGKCLWAAPKPVIAEKNGKVVARQEVEDEGLFRISSDYQPKVNDVLEFDVDLELKLFEGVGQNDESVEFPWWVVAEEQAPAESPKKRKR